MPKIMVKRKRKGFKMQRLISGDTIHTIFMRQMWKKDNYEYQTGREVKNEMHTAQALNGEIRPYDWVIVVPSDTYGCLVGVVTEIIPFGSPEYDTDDIHIDFMDTDYSDKRKNEIVEQMSGLYGEDKPFDDLPLDNVIKYPDSLIRITGIELCILTKLLESRETAEAFCNQVIMERRNV